MKILALFPFLLVCGCGVKGPPVAPTRDPVPTVLRLDCSPQDPKCDEEDPKYKPQGVPATGTAR